MPERDVIHVFLGSACRFSANLLIVLIVNVCDCGALGERRRERSVDSNPSESAAAFPFVAHVKRQTQRKDLFSFPFLVAGAFFCGSDVLALRESERARERGALDPDLLR